VKAHTDPRHTQDPAPNTDPADGLASRHGIRDAPRTTSHHTRLTMPCSTRQNKRAEKPPSSPPPAVFSVGVRTCSGAAALRDRALTALHGIQTTDASAPNKARREKQVSGSDTDHLPSDLGGWLIVKKSDHVSPGPGADSPTSQTAGARALCCSLQSITRSADPARRWQPAAQATVPLVQMQTRAPCLPNMWLC